MKVVIDKYDDLGQGLAKIQNKVCFIKGGIPNEIIDIDVIKDNKNYSVGIIKEIINKSNFRVNPICKYYNECGGCDFLHMKEDLEINFKIERSVGRDNARSRARSGGDRRDGDIARVSDAFGGVCRSEP